ncbi:unnamed protein product [Allacma fusca]|uniref:Uncharacterized protein n=1 Tax=Allacma fusca TaxID=39272 RepID=A0A8J2KTI9_9HEXA|nr:unnamed protein product [Allacma fusca]
MNERHGHMRRHSSQQQQQPSQQTLHEHYQEAIEASEAAAHRREKRDAMYMGSKQSKKSRMEGEVTVSPSRHTVPSN